VRAGDRVVVLVDDEVVSRRVRVGGVEGAPGVEGEDWRTRIRGWIWRWIGTRIGTGVVLWWWCLSVRGVGGVFAEVCGDGLQVVVGRCLAGLEGGERHLWLCF